mmetsp:Transcript_3604/g.9074  ORF Transcript_3604/g.9074 Transcript_3604/m.9074 type:complete len:853 (+) Transcript_3604:70-2628(+)
MESLSSKTVGPAALLRGVCTPVVCETRTSTQSDDVDEFRVIETKAASEIAWQNRLDAIDGQLRILQAAMELMPERISAVLQERNSLQVPFEPTPMPILGSPSGFRAGSKGRSASVVGPPTPAARRGSRMDVPRGSLLEPRSSKRHSLSSMTSPRMIGPGSPLHRSTSPAPPPDSRVPPPPPESRPSATLDKARSDVQPDVDFVTESSAVQHGKHVQVPTLEIPDSLRRDSMITASEVGLPPASSEGDGLSRTASAVDRRTSAAYGGHDSVPTLRPSRWDRSTFRAGSDNVLELTGQSAEDTARSATLAAGHSLLDMDDMVPQFVMRPDNVVRLVFDGILVCALIYTTVLCPVAATYFDDHDDFRDSAIGIVLQIVDSVFLIDIVLSFRTGYFDGNTGNTILDPKQIAHHYLRRWFWLDIVTVWPIALTPLGALSWVYALKSARLLRLHSLVVRVQMRFGGNWMRRVAAGVMVLLLAHVMACMWRHSLDYDGVPLPEDQLWEVYVLDMYFLTMTMTTIGYGDIFPQGNASRLYGMFAMLLASFCFASVVSTMTHTTRRLFEDETESLVKDTRLFMQRRRVPKELQRRAEQSLRHHMLLEKRTTLDPKVFASLSPNIQKELSLALLSSTVLQFPLFRGALHSFVAELALAHEWVHCATGDLVAEEGQLILDIVFLVQGRLIAHFSLKAEGTAFDMDCEDGQVPHVYTALTTPKESIVEAPAWFGEACLFGLNRVFAATFVAAVDSELAILPATEYLRIVQKYPRLLEQQRSLERQVKANEVDLSVLDYRAAFHSPAPGPSRSTQAMPQLSLAKRTPEMRQRTQSYPSEAVSELANPNNSNVDPDQSITSEKFDC